MRRSRLLVSIENVSKNAKVICSSKLAIGGVSCMITRRKMKLKAIEESSRWKYGLLLSSKLLYIRLSALP